MYELWNEVHVTKLNYEEVNNHRISVSDAKVQKGMPFPTRLLHVSVK